ncbi:MAG: 50S ribosomal protein L21e [Candidatus Nanoarchaeia archaeon]
MVKRAGSFRSRTRKKLRKIPRTSGKISLTKLLQTFKIGEKVIIDPEPAVHEGMPHPRFKGRHAIVIEKIGSAYKLEVRDGNSKKYLIAKPIHLTRVK